MKNSIQHQVLVSLSIVTFIGLASLLLVAYRISDQNVTRIVHSNVVQVKKNLDVYLSQYFLINNVAPDANTLASQAEHISAELSSQVDAAVEILPKPPGKVAPTAASPSSDVYRAFRGETVYSIHHRGPHVIVRLTSPIVSGTAIIGVIQYQANDSALFRENRRFEAILNIFAVIIFVIIVGTSFIISRKITGPLRELTRKTEMISSGALELDLRMRTNDEIGQLARRFQDMLHRIKGQIETINADRDALQVARAQSKVFFDNVTHELKTPLTTIFGYAQMLRDNGFHDEAFFDKGTAYIMNETQRLTRLVAQILEMSKSEHFSSLYRFAPVNLSNLLTATCEEMTVKGEQQRVDIRCDVQPDLLVMADRDKLKQVLINIIDNAIKYGDNSSIDVQAKAIDQSVTVRITDYGRGIPKELLSKVFEPFYRVSRADAHANSSAGLGLAISKTIVENHGGHLDLLSEINHGTTVVISLERSMP